jgi:hypothetical protein
VELHVADPVQAATALCLSFVSRSYKDDVDDKTKVSVTLSEFQPTSKYPILLRIQSFELAFDWKISSSSEAKRSVLSPDPHPLTAHSSHPLLDDLLARFATVHLGRFFHLAFFEFLVFTVVLQKIPARFWHHAKSGSSASLYTLDLSLYAINRG